MDYNAPNTRQRVAARRQSRQSQSDGSSLVHPGLRRVALAWLISGRLAGGALFLASILALGAIFIDPRFNMGQIEVEGNSALSTAQVGALAAISGQPIWFVRPEAVVERLRASAYVESASVELALPNRAIIRIAERRAEVRWQAGGLQYLVDSDGQVLDVAQEVATPDVLVIIDNSHLELKPNDRIDTDALTLAQTLALRLPNELGLIPAQLGWDIGLGVYVRSASGQTIVFGRSEDLERKLAALRLLLDDKTVFTYLDLRPSNPFYQNTAVGTQ